MRADHDAFVPGPTWQNTFRKLLIMMSCRKRHPIEYVQEALDYDDESETETE